MEYKPNKMYETVYNNPTINDREKQIVGFRYTYEKVTESIRSLQFLFAEKDKVKEACTKNSNGVMLIICLASVLMFEVSTGLLMKAYRRCLRQHT